MKLGLISRLGVIVGSLCKLPLDFMAPNNDPVPMLIFGPLLLLCLLFFRWAPGLLVAWGALLFAYGVFRGLSPWWDTQRELEAGPRRSRGRPRPTGPTARERELADQQWAWQQKRTAQQADEADGLGLMWWEDADR